MPQSRQAVFVRCCLYSHLEYNAKVVSAEMIARVLDGETLEQTKAPAETVEPAPEKKSTRKKSASKKPAAKKTSDKKTANTKSTAKTTDEPAPKRAGGRKAIHLQLRANRKHQHYKNNVEKSIARKRERKRAILVEKTVEISGRSQLYDFTGTSQKLYYRKKKRVRRKS